MLHRWQIPKSTQQLAAYTANNLPKHLALQTADVCGAPLKPQNKRFWHHDRNNGPERAGVAQQQTADVQRPHEK